MKDIKTFIIGFLTCCCMFLIMGQRAFLPPSEIGRYQISSWKDNKLIASTMIDSKTGEVYFTGTSLEWIQSMQKHNTANPDSLKFLPWMKWAEFRD